MPVAKQQVTQDYVLAKIDHIYAIYKESEAKKRQQAIRKQRRQFFNAKAEFQKKLDQAISPRMQAGLGMKILLERKRLPQFHFVVRFEFLGQWLISRNRSLLGFQWQCWVENQTIFTHCTSGNLEHQLCCALGQHRDSTTRKGPVLKLLPSLRAS